MSANKRRKIDGQAAASPTASAVSAISARRRLAGPSTGSADEPSSATTEPKSAIGSSNAFSVLQGLSRQGNSTTVVDAGNSHQATPKKKVAKKFLDPSSAAITGDSALKPVQLSSFRPTKRNYRERADDVIELRLEESERFLVLGSFGIKVLEGEVSVAGASLRPNDEVQWIHAPHCHAVPVLRTRENTRLELHGDSHASALRRLGRLSPLFRKIWNEPGESTDVKGGLKHLMQILYSSEDAPKKSIIQDLVSPPAWNKTFSTLTNSASGENPITLVCGPKSAGKSTFTRLLTNRLVSRRSKDVAILDLDPGQPEYGPPGTMSLVVVTQPNFGPSFTHPSMNNVVRGHALASTSPASDPELYLECAIDLYNTYRKTVSHIPLVVNTPGWILGTGLELLEALIKHFEPENVIYMSEDGPLETVEALQAATTTNFTMLPSQPPEFTARTAAHLRAMQMMSYFHLAQVDNPQTQGRLVWNPEPLSNFPPTLVSYSDTRAGIAGIISYDYQSPPELLAEAINGMVLAAVEIEDHRAYRGLLLDGQQQPRVERTPEGIPFMPNHEDVTLSPEYSRILGLVLIRGIDVVNQQLQLITPMPMDRVRSAKRQSRDIVLVHGKFDAPNWAYTEELYVKSSEDGSGGKGLEIQQDDTSEDDSDMEPENMKEASDMLAVPWVEVLKGNEKRPVGSKVWRVRRDLGRNNDG